MNDQEKKRLEGLAKSVKDSYLLRYLEKVKDHVSDVRTEIDVDPTVAVAVRLAMVKMIEELLIEPLNRLGRDDQKPSEPEDFQ